MIPTVEQIIYRHSKPLSPQSTGEQPRLRPMPGIRAVVFDIYGTLLCSSAGDIALMATDDRQKYALYKTLVTLGLPVANTIPRALTPWLQAWISHHQDNRRAQGIAYPEVDIRLVWRDWLDELQQHGYLPAGDYRAQTDILAMDYECRVNPCWPMPYLLPTLQQLMQRQQALAIISNAQFFTPLLVEVLVQQPLGKLGFDLDASVWSYKLLEAKPSTALYKRCAKALYDRYAIAVEETLYVGNDRLNDIWPAQQLGYRTALFAGDARSLRWRSAHAALAEVTPDLVITDLRQLLLCLEQ